MFSSATLPTAPPHTPIRFSGLKIEMEPDGTHYRFELDGKPARNLLVHHGNRYFTLSSDPGTIQLIDWLSGQFSTERDKAVFEDVFRKTLRVIMHRLDDYFRRLPDGAPLARHSKAFYQQLRPHFPDIIDNGVLITEPLPTNLRHYGQPTATLSRDVKPLDTEKPVR